MDTVITGLRNGCVNCRESLNLTGTVAETRCGLASVLSIRCEVCEFVTLLAMPNTHWTIEQKRGRPAYAVNTKATLGMINAGIRSTDISALLTAMNMPAWRHKPMKKREREIGKHIEAVAKASCATALEEECALSSSQSGCQLPQKDGKSTASANEKMILIV